MKQIPALPATDIALEGDCIIIKQVESYREHTVKIPVICWAGILGLIEDEIFPLKAKHE